MHTGGEMSKGAGLGDTRIRSRNGRQTRRMSGIVLRKLQTRAPWDPGRAWEALAGGSHAGACSRFSFRKLAFQ